jgi:hypothetical protein
MMAELDSCLTRPGGQSLLIPDAGVSDWSRESELAIIIRFRLVALTGCAGLARLIRQNGSHFHRGYAINNGFRGLS